MNIDHDNKTTGAVIGAAIAVHRSLGPGVEEPACEEALSAKLTSLGIAHECQKPLPLTYKGASLDCGFRIDLFIENRLPVELKAVEAILPIHEAQLLTYMRIGDYSLGLLINFEVPVLKDGIRREVLTKPRPGGSASRFVSHDKFDSVSNEILTAALEVHRTLGPGLIRSAYEECLCYELHHRNIDFVRNVPVPLVFEGSHLTHAAEIPLVVGGKVPVYCLSVSKLTQLHQSRLVARLRQSDWPYGFLINFNAPLLVEGIRRLQVNVESNISETK